MDQEVGVAHSQLFTHHTRYQEGSQPVISPRRHVYGVPGEDCTKGGDGSTMSELRREYHLAWKL